MPRHPTFALLAGVTLGLALVSSASAEEARSPDIKFSGDIRLLVSGLDRTDRSGAQIDTDEGGMRLRTGLTWKWSERVSFVGRFATSASTGGNHWRVDSFEGAQTSSGLATGDMTLDQAHVLLTPTDSVRVRIGRFQDVLALPGVPDKSLDRKDSDNMAINYTDGASVDWRVGGGWSLLGIAQYNPAEGPTNRARSPLTYSDSGSRMSGFLALRKVEDNGFWALRSLSLTVLPHTQPASSDASTYAAAVGNVAVRWPARSQGMHMLVGGSVGYAPEVPRSANAYEDPEWAWQASANLMNFARWGQGIGVVWMRSGAGWLVSPDLASNTQLWEIRYRINPLQPLTVEMRLRYRSDDERPIGARSSQRDRDWYLRATWRF